jgi:hypothetical protein
MRAGEYVYDDSIKYITKNDSDSKKRAVQIFQNNYYQRSIRFFIFLLRKSLFKKKFTIPEQNNQLIEFSGTVYRPVRSSNGYSDSKIFDLSRNQVLSIFTNKDDFCSVINNYENFKEYFPMPPIMRADEEELLIIEELILFEQNHTWIKDDYSYLMMDIFKRYYDYFTVCTDKGIDSYNSPRDLLDFLTNRSEINFIRNYINPELFDMKFPWLRLHGDLWTSNTLLVKAEKKYVFYIDWEYSREFIFFYDFFNLMWLEVYVNNNHFFIEKYAIGDYDYYLKRIFPLFNMTFNDKFRLDYFGIFFLNFFNERVAHLDKIDKIDFLKQYKGLLEKLNS